MDATTNLLVLYLALLIINICVSGAWFQNRTSQQRNLLLAWSGWTASFLLQGLSSELGPLWITVGFATLIPGNIPAGRVLAGVVGRELPARRP